MKRTLHRYADPSHSWLKVRTSDLEKLCLLAEISVYSYTRGEFSYLEEDCDAPKYFRAVSAANWEYKVIDHHTNKSSKIRSYQYY